jgi:LysM repeat protein
MVNCWSFKELFSYPMRVILRILPTVMLCVLSFLEADAQGVKTQAHEITVGQTFFGIARQYNLPVSELMKANPGVAADSIRPGQVLLIPILNGSSVRPTDNAPANFNPQPFTHSRKAVAAQVPQAEVKPATPAVVTQPSASMTSSAQDGSNAEQVLFHLVEEKQTLYAIARLYGVRTEEIIEWNKLPDNNIQIGSKLLIKTSAAVKTEIVELSGAGDALRDPIANIDTKSIATHKAAVPQNGLQDQLYQSFLDAKSRNQAVSAGRYSISWLKSNSDKMSSGYFALHKSAPVGTIIKVTNLVSKKYVFVKVIGKLPESADNISIQMRMSEQAQRDLQFNGEKAYVELEFYP